MPQETVEFQSSCILSWSGLASELINATRTALLDDSLAQQLFDVKNMVVAAGPKHATTHLRSSLPWRRLTSAPHNVSEELVVFWPERHRRCERVVALPRPALEEVSRGKSADRNGQPLPFTQTCVYVFRNGTGSGLTCLLPNAGTTTP